MTDREKLVEVLAAHCRKSKHCIEEFCELHREYCQSDVADHLIAHGVTFAKDTDVPSKWISVEDRLPEHGGVVLCHHLKKRDYPIVCQWDERSGAWVDDHWSYGMGCFTHWMPLPQPPREE